jgi:AhpC/TSA family
MSLMIFRKVVLSVAVILVTVVAGCEVEDRRTVSLPKGMRRNMGSGTMAKPTGIAGGSGDVVTIATFGRWSPVPNLMFLSEPVARYSEVIWEQDSVSDKQRLQYMIIDAGYMLGDVEADMGFKRLMSDAKLVSEIYWEQSHAFAQTSHPDDAIMAIRNSVRFGMSDAQRLLRSTDLETLRDLAGFKQLVEECSKVHHAQTAATVQASFPKEPVFINSEYGDLAGNSVDISQQLDELGVIYFWGSWSRPCREMLPCLESTRQAFENRGVKCMGIALEPGSRDAQAHIKIAMKEAQANFPVYLDQLNDPRRLELAQELLPMTIIVNRQMRVLAKISGYQSGDVLTGVLNTLQIDGHNAPSF